MRWYWIDRMIALESGCRAVAIKNVIMSGEEMHDHASDLPFMPASLVLEGIAVTGGLMVAEICQFRRNVVLVKVAKARFHGCALPGDALTYTVTMQHLNAEGALVRGTGHIGTQLLAEVELFFAYLESGVAGVDIISDDDYARIMRQLRVYEVAVGPDGRRLEFPAWLLESER